jgi:hypothetical protein
MYDLALQFLFKRSRPELEAMNALTLKTLLGWGLAAESALASDLAESTDYSNAIPVYELTALSQDLDDLPGSQDPRVFRLQNTHAASCVSSEPLEFAEYQIASSVCASSRAGEIPLPNDKLRVQMYRRVHSIMGTKTSDPEVITCFDTNEKRYSAISQKQALLLMLHYLKYVIHSTRDSKFGMLTYEQDVRVFMQRDVPLARGVAQVAAKASALAPEVQRALVTLLDPSNLTPDVVARLHPAARELCLKGGEVLAREREQVDSRIADLLAFRFFVPDTVAPIDERKRVSK